MEPTTKGTPMGYGIVLHLNHRLLGDTDALGRDLITVCGNDHYPSGGLGAAHAGAWTRYGAFHANHSVRFRLSADRIDDRVDGDSDGVFSAVATLGELNTAIKNLSRHPHQLAVARASGDPLGAVLGADPVPADEVTASAWWVYADAVDDLADVDRSQLGVDIATVAVARADANLTIGRFISAINCAGRVGASPVVLEWAGNRIHRPDPVPV
jgi:hypothetical protein